jgi:phytoene dehydrogenase-like protein
LVVGGGVSGLAAAARLAAGGHAVTVVERGAAPGGALPAVAPDPGSDNAADSGASAGTEPYEAWDSFSSGAYTLTLPAAFRDLFLKTGPREGADGLALEDNVDLRALDPVRRYVFPDGTAIDLPNAARGKVREVFAAAFGETDADGWLKVLDHGNRAWSAIRPRLIEAPGSGQAELRRLLRSRAGFQALKPGRSLRALSRDWFHDPRVGLILDDYALGAGADPRRAPAALCARIYVEHVFGAWQVGGGLGRLTGAMYERALARGVDFRFGTQATAITRNDAGGVEGLRLSDGGQLSADVVVAAVDLAGLTSLTVQRPARPVSYSHSVFTLFVQVPQSVTARPTGPGAGAAMPHETVLFGDPHPDAVGVRLEELFGPNAKLVDDPTIRVHVPAWAPTQWTIHVEAPRHSTHRTAGAIDWTTDEEVASGYAWHVLDVLARRGLDLGPAARIVRIITPADRERQTGAPGGAAYGPAPDSLRSALLRSPVAQPMPGLFHIGESARPGAGLSLAALSAWHAATLIGEANPGRSRAPR